MVPALREPTTAEQVPQRSIIDDLVEDFLRTLKERTRRAYDGVFRDFASFLEVELPRMPEAFMSRGAGEANRMAMRYRNAMHARGLAPATIAQRLSALRSLTELFRTVARIDWSLSVRGPRQVKPRRDVRGPGREGWLALAETIRKRTRDPTLNEQRRAIAARDLAIVRLLHDTMLRRFEVAGLDLSHVEAGSDGLPAAVSILGKGRDERERIALPNNTRDALGAWLAKRGSHAGPLFSPLDRPIDPNRPRRLSESAVSELVTKAGKAAKLERRVRAHGLRHEGITRAYSLTRDLVQTQRAARHQDPRTTERYIDVLNDPTPKIHRLVSED